MIKNRPSAVTPSAIRDHFKNIYLLHNNGQESFQQYLEKYLFFLSVTFRNPAESSHPQLFKEFGKFYFLLSRRLLGNNLSRKRRLQPLTYAFIDFEGSRSGKSDALNSAMPHIHALMLVLPQHIEAFNDLHSEQFARVSVPTIVDMHADRFSTARGGVETLISYSMKGFLQTPKEYFAREDLWSLFPM